MSLLRRGLFNAIDETNLCPSYFNLFYSDSRPAQDPKVGFIYNDRPFRSSVPSGYKIMMK